MRELSLQITNRFDRLNKYLFRKMPNINDNIYILAFIMCVTANFMWGTMFMRFHLAGFLNILTQISVVLLFFKLLIIDRLSWKIFLPAVLSCALVYYISGRAAGFGLYYSYIFVIGAVNVNLKKVVKAFVITISLYLAITIISALVGIIPNLSYGRTNSEVVRYALGTIYPTDLAARIFYLMLAYAFLKKFKFNIFDYVGCVLLAVGAYVVTDTRLSVLLMVLLILVVATYKYCVKVMLWMGNKVITALMLLLTAGGILAAYFYTEKNPVFEFLNKLLSGRLYFEHLAFKWYNVPILGQIVYQNGSGGTDKKVINYFFIDSSFIRVLMMYGVVMFIITMGIIIFLSHRFMLKNCFALEIGLILVVLSSIIDQHLWELSFNLLFLATFSNIDYFKEDKLVYRN
ncbi:hypothetical protein JCM15457_1215 [Liquorilactobacillus sucicola DSM 21376 = JCM 15457]|nr:hypothetical protein [Liquorilactobacillus sucicola]GAJ26292.1 hypothetical protein JCM15457_1215 [Liquorilactobacillus sucicola DSM 21376 = JCM 15457]